MAEETYTYSILNDTLNGKVNTTKLFAQIIESAIITSLNRINTDGDDLDIVFNATLSSGDETILDGIVAAHDGEALILPDLNTITDYDNTDNKAGITADNKLKVVLPPPTAPSGATAINRTEYDGVSGDDDNVYIIPNGETLIIQRLSSGSEVTSDGATTELWYDPNGTGVGMTIIDAIFSNGSSDQHDLNESYTGDGTKAVRMRRRNLTGGTVSIFGRWEGYY